ARGQPPAASTRSRPPRTETRRAAAAVSGMATICLRLRLAARVPRWPRGLLLRQASRLLLVPERGKDIRAAQTPSLMAHAYALLDFWYLDKLLVAGGVVGFDDCNFPSVRKVIEFVLLYRKYQELDVGLPVSAENYAGTNGMAKRLLGRRLLTHVRRMAGRPR